MTTQSTLKQLEKEIDALKERNHRVEAEKAWETSWFRRITVLILTYIVITLFFLAAKFPDPFLNSIVPTLAFVLSTSSLPLFKKIWKKFNQ
jgi:hypothetical protein